MITDQNQPVRLSGRMFSALYSEYLGVTPRKSRSMPSHHILVVSGRLTPPSHILDCLKSWGWSPLVAIDADEVRSLMDIHDPMAVVLGPTSDESTRMEVLNACRERRSGYPCVLLGGEKAFFSGEAILQGDGVHVIPEAELASSAWEGRLESLLRTYQRPEENAKVTALDDAHSEESDLSVRLRMISESTRTLSRSITIEKIGPRLLEDFARNMSAMGGSLFVNRRNELVLVHTLDNRQPVPRTIQFPLRKDSPFERAILEKKPLIPTDVARHGRMTRNGWGGYQDDSFLVAPLIWDAGEIVGIISLHNKLNPPFTALDREVGAVLASLVSESLRTARALEALRESEERYRVLVEHATDGILLQVGGRYIYANRAILEMLDYTEEEFLRLKFTDVMPETTLGREFILKMYRDRMAGRDVPNRYEAQYLTRHGEILDVMLSVSRITYAGEDGVTIIVTDITERKRADQERKRLESQLLQSQKLESVGRLAGGVAHDFNNLLSAILGYSEMALIQIPDDHPAKEKVRTIRRAGQKAAALTKQLLAFSRKQVLEIKPTDLNFVIENLGKMLGRMIGEDINLEINTAPAVRSVMADAGQIEQVIMNLAVNARDAMPRGGGLIIETANLDVRPNGRPFGDAVNPGSYVLVTVTDTGEGMDKDVQERIFEPFFTTKEVGEGTGLGLATVYGIIKQHEGYIFVSSEKERGTSFRVYLPAVHTQAEYAQHAETAPGPLIVGNETIFVVDDEPTIRQLCADVLRPLGYTVITAGTGEEAMTKLESYAGRVDVLLTDVVMPGMNGRELADLFIGKSPQTRLVFMSGYLEKDIDLGSYQKTDIVLIRKPLTGSILTSTLRRVLERV